MEEKWERVVNPKAKAKPQKQSKSQKQTLLKNMPKIEDLPISKIQSPMFEGGEIGDVLQNTTNHQNQSPKSAKVSKRKPKKNAESKKIFKTVDEALQNYEDLPQFEDKVDEMIKKFPENPIIWLKDVASYLNMSLHCSEVVTAESATAADYPLSKMPKVINRVLTKCLGKTLPPTVVPIIYNFCLTSMLDCVARDLPALGYQLCIQVLAHHHHLQCVDKSWTDMVREVQNSQNNPKKCFAYLWAISQTGTDEAGPHIWLHLMLPTLHVRCVTAFSMSYIESIVDRGQLTGDQVKLTPHQLCEVARWALGGFDAASKAHSNARDRMVKLLPAFTQVLMRNSASKQEFFNYFLNSARIESVELRNKLLDLVLECLKSEANCWSLWRDRYLSNLPRTRLLLEHLNQHVNELLVRGGKRHDCEETIRSFCITNDELHTRADPIASKSDFHQIKRLCELITVQLGRVRAESTSRVGAVIVSTIVVVIAVAVGAIGHDLRRHEGVWRDTDTFRTLRDSGALALFRHVDARTRHVVARVADIVQENVPYYWLKWCEIMQPYKKVIAEFSQTTFNLVVDLTQPSLAWLSSHLADFCDLVEVNAKSAAIVLLDWVDVVLGHFRVFVSACVERAVRLATQLYGKEVEWDVLYRNALDHATASRDYVASGAQALFRFVVEYVSPGVER